MAEISERAGVFGPGGVAWINCLRYRVKPWADINSPRFLSQEPERKSYEVCLRALYGKGNYYRAESQGLT